MGRAAHGITFDVDAMGHPSLASSKSKHVTPLHSPLSFVVFLAYSITLSVTYHAPSLVSLSRANPSPKLKSNLSIFPKAFLKLSPNLLALSPFTIKQFTLKIIVIALSDTQLFQAGQVDQH